MPSNTTPKTTAIIWPDWLVVSAQLVRKTCSLHSQKDSRTASRQRYSSTLESFPISSSELSVSCFFLFIFFFYFYNGTFFSNRKVPYPSSLAILHQRIMSPPKKKKYCNIPDATIYSPTGQSLKKKGRTKLFALSLDNFHLYLSLYCVSL